MIAAVVLINLLMILIFAVEYHRLPPQIPLFYSKLWGEDQLGEVWMIFLLPVIRTAINTASHIAVPPSYMEALAVSISVRAQMDDWYSYIA